jgi:hypothetical protein
MKLSLLWCSALVIIANACGVPSDISVVRQEIRRVEKEFATDRRVAVFKVDTALSKRPAVLIGETNLPQAKASLLSALKAKGIPLIDSLRMLPSDALNGMHHGVVTVSVCNLRSQPRHAAELSTQALMGTSLRVLKQENGFYLVQTPDDYLGWLDEGGFQLMDSMQFVQWMKSAHLIFVAEFGFAHSLPDESSTIITDLTAGCIAADLGRQGDFVKIGLADGRTGYVRQAALMPFPDWLNSREPVAANLLATAEKMMGRPYLWGGTSGKGMDCSGFTKMVFFLNGLQLPRDASQQVAVGDPIDSDSTLKHLQPGDLLFFGSRATASKREKITHVAIYMGEGQIIHASDRVKVESLIPGEPGFVEYRLKSFLRARRMYGAESKPGVVPIAASPHYPSLSPEP